MRAMHRHDYIHAAEAFRTVLTQYPEEKELNERIRVYLAACDRHLQAESEPQDQEERLYAATLALNAGDIDRAVHHLEAVVAEDGEHDGALYMLGVGYALRNDHGAALTYLLRAIEKNPANRLAALQDGDLERLLQDESARAALQGDGDAMGASLPRRDARPSR
jgi:outer membrane protein assembly factor BamD (BamD/ComL family)